MTTEKKKNRQFSAVMREDLLDGLQEYCRQKEISSSSFYRRGMLKEFKSDYENLEFRKNSLQFTLEYQDQLKLTTKAIEDHKEEIRFYERLQANFKDLYYDVLAYLNEGEI